MKPLHLPRHAVAVSALLLLTPFAVHAADAKVASAFGNTVLSVYPDGRSQKIWMHPDGTWDGRSRRGNPLAGRWTVRDDKVCVKQSKPAMPFSFCIPFPADPHVGSVWPFKDMTGTPIKLKIVAGKVASTAQDKPAA